MRSSNSAVIPRLRRFCVGIGYGMNVGIVLDPSHANFNGGANGAGTFYWGGVHGTWFWVDPTYDIVVVGMLQQQDGGESDDWASLSGAGCVRHSAVDHLRCAC
jgi:CubicO group peptidase (beta-lactamase class C family)